jgi:hypothetical protein
VHSDYDCGPLCVDNDDQEFSFFSAGNNGAALTNWERKFVAAITSNSHFEHVQKCNIEMHSHSIQEEDEQQQEDSGDPAMVSESESRGTRVYIDVKCKGLDLSKLSLKDEIVAGRILEDSYNKVHEEAGNDSKLGDVTHRDAGEVAAAGSDGNNVDCRNVPWCRWNCWDDTYMGYEGDFDCGPLCPNDDDADLTLFLGAGGAGVCVWEVDYVSGLLVSRRAVFRGVEQCNVMMRPALAVEVGLRVNTPQLR